MGLDRTEVESVALATTELATNLLKYARHGNITLIPLKPISGAAGIEVVSGDEGPGIPDVAAAMQNGHSTGGGLGGGLPGVNRLMDEMEITTGPSGTRIVARKWAKQSNRRQPVTPLV
jgi:serine/threonine-protein kinase RsbT